MRALKDGSFLSYPKLTVSKSHVTTMGYRMEIDFSHPKANKHGHVLGHRLAMERCLGRYLESYENVHHKNGDRADNRIKPGHEYGGCSSDCCNLELWSTKQPSGQRIPDKLTFAREIIARYDPPDDESILELNLRA